MHFLSDTCNNWKKGIMHETGEVHVIPHTLLSSKLNIYLFPCIFKIPVNKNNLIQGRSWFNNTYFIFILRRMIKRELKISGIVWYVWFLSFSVLMKDERRKLNIHTCICRCECMCSKCNAYWFIRRRRRYDRIQKYKYHTSYIHTHTHT